MSEQPPWDPKQGRPQDPPQQPYGPPPPGQQQPYPPGQPQYGQQQPYPPGQPQYGQPGPGQYPGQQPLYQGQPYWQPGGQPPYPGPGPQLPRRRKRHLVRAILAGIGAALAAIIVINALSSHGSGVPTTASGSSSAQSAVVTTAAAALPSGGQQFASDMQNTFSFGPAVTDAEIAAFGQQVCQARQSGTSVAGEVPAVQQDWSNTSAGDAIQMITLAAKDMCPSEQTAQTVTYVVTGTSGADVTYGPSGSDLTGSVPMSVTQPLGNPSYYAINAQLQGYGEVSCELEVDGVAISSSTASGGYNIAACEIGQDPTTGSWENDNSG